MRLTRADLASMKRAPAKQIRSMALFSFPFGPLSICTASRLRLDCARHNRYPPPACRQDRRQTGRVAMASSKWHFAGWVLGIAGTIGSLAAGAEGQEFRVDTEVFQNQDKKPILEQLTIFADDGTIYDFRLTEPQ